MAFAQPVVLQAWKRAGARCECRRAGHSSHGASCGKQPVQANRGRQGRGAWEAHHKVHGGPDTLGNCEILCWECHSLTF